jgi:Leucine-rich repeat (LRR) protein
MSVSLVSPLNASGSICLKRKHSRIVFFSGVQAPRTECTYHHNNGSADCSHMKLTSVPSNLPNSTIHLDMSYNQIHTLRNRSLEYLMNLEFLDLSYNKLGQIELKFKSA